jgi:hypothetical protein
MPSTQPELRYGCSRKVTLISKKNFSNAEIVNFGLILGGLAVTLLRVSRIEVREGTMGLPVLVWSQYCRFWAGVSYAFNKGIPKSLHLRH